MPRPKKFYDEQGYARVTLKKGSARQPGGPHPHAQYVQADGRRVNAFGMPVERSTTFAFPSIEWDLEDDPEDLGEGADEIEAAAHEAEGAGEGAGDALDFDEVAALSFRSPTLQRALQSLDASGFVLMQGPTQEANQVILGAARVLIDPALAAEHTLTGVVARELGRALFVSPKVGARGRDRDTFVRENTAISLRDEGEALIFAEQVRSEIVTAGGPDVGVPGATEAVLRLCEAVREGRAPRNETAMELGKMALAPTHEDGDARYSELWSRVYDLCADRYSS